MIRMISSTVPRPMYIHSLLSVASFFSARPSRQTSGRRDTEEDSRCELRLEDMRASIVLRLLIAALTMFALLAAFVELLAGRRPILVGGTGKVIASRAALGRA
jgi:hypothetical protein